MTTSHEGPAASRHTDIATEFAVLAELANVNPERQVPPEVDDAFARLSPEAFGTHEGRDIFQALAASRDDAGAPDPIRAAESLRGDTLTIFGQNVVGTGVSPVLLPRRVAKLLRLKQLRGLQVAIQAAGDKLNAGDTAGFHAELHNLDAHDANNDVLLALPFDADVPEPVLWRDPGDNTDYRDPLLATGEVAVLAGPGKAGKSTVVLALAAAMGSTAEHGEACGLRVRPGNCILLGYEDAPVVLANRARWYAEPDHWDHVRVVNAPEPLWAGDPDDNRTSTPTPWWPRFWRAARRFDPALVVIDPASVAFSGPGNDASQVRAFIAALRREAEAADCGVLVVAHDTKAARMEASYGTGDPGAGAVQGSSQWVDGSRGLLHLARLHKSMRAAYADKATVLRCEHSNYGPSGWGTVLQPQYSDKGRWHGFSPHPVERINDVDEWLDEAKRAKADAKQDAKAEEKATVARQFADFIKPLRKPGATTTISDLKAAFIRHSDTSPDARLFSQMLDANGIEKARTRTADGKRPWVAQDIELP